jgi:hypothetical protein
MMMTRVLNVNRVTTEEKIQGRNVPRVIIRQSELRVVLRPRINLMHRSH